MSMIGIYSDIYFLTEITISSIKKLGFIYSL